MRQIAGYSLWLGNVDDVRDLSKVINNGIEAIVDLALNESALPSLPREIVYCRFPLVDGAENSPWLLHSAVHSVVNLVASGTTSLVYYSLGMSRTPAIASAAIAIIRKCSLSEALDIVTQEGSADISPGLLDSLQKIVD